MSCTLGPPSFSSELDILATSEPASGINYNRRTWHQRIIAAVLLLPEPPRLLMTHPCSGAPGLPPACNTTILTLTRA